MITDDQISRILKLHTDGLPIVSLYAQVPAGPDSGRALRSRVDSLLSEIRPMTSDASLDRTARLSVRADIEHIEEHLEKGQSWRPGALALFSCSAHQIFEEIALPRAVRDRVIVDSTPWVRSLLAVLNEYHRMCVVFVERGEASLWELYQDELREVTRLRDRTLRARHTPASSEDRARNKANEITKRHFRDVVATIDTLFRTDRFDLLAVGGQQHETPQFVDLLPRHLRDRLAGTFTLDNHPSEAARVRLCAGAILRKYEQAEQRRRVTELVQTVAAGGRAALGFTDCLRAGTQTAIDELLLDEGAVIPGVLCDNCGWMAVRGRVCPQCGHRLRPVADILDELTEAVINDSGSIFHVSVPTELSRHLVGALLRFPPAL
jgi:peptide chain release factor subunit 1